MRVFIVSVKQALCGMGFALSVLGVVCAALLSNAEGFIAAFRSSKLLESGYCLSMILSALKSDALIFTMPILCAIPYTASFIDDIKSGFIKAELPRTTLNGYIWSKGIACAISGGLCVLLGLISSFIIIVLIVLPMEVKGTIDYSEIIGGTLLYFCSGALWASVGMVFSAFTFSKYMAYASPFVVYYVLIILHERYFDSLYALYPREWLFPSDAWMFGEIGVALIVFEIIAILLLCFSIIAKRRLTRI